MNSIPSKSREQYRDEFLARRAIVTEMLQARREQREIEAGVRPPEDVYIPRHRAEVQS